MLPLRKHDEYLLRKASKLPSLKMKESMKEVLIGSEKTLGRVQLFYCKASLDR